MEQAWYEKPPAKNPRSRPELRKIAPDDVRRIRLAREKGWSLYSLAKRFDVTPPVIASIVSRKTYKDVE